MNREKDLKSNCSIVCSWWPGTISKPSCCTARRWITNTTRLIPISTSSVSGCIDGRSFAKLRPAGVWWWRKEQPPPLVFTHDELRCRPCFCDRAPGHQKSSSHAAGRRFPRSTRNSMSGCTVCRSNVNCAQGWFGCARPSRCPTFAAAKSPTCWWPRHPALLRLLRYCPMTLGEHAPDSRRMAAIMRSGWVSFSAISFGA